MKMYIPKPETVEGCSLKGLFYFKVDQYPQWVQDLFHQNVLRCYGRHLANGYVELDTPYGVQKASYDDYIIKTRYGYIRLVNEKELCDTFDLLREGGRSEQLKPSKNHGRIFDIV